MITRIIINLYLNYIYKSKNMMKNIGELSMSVTTCY